ncbi:MAG TPA: response regulator [bacterium]|nr:response regulator [bacterium]
MTGQQKNTILLVEDETIIAMQEKMVLEDFGYNVITVNSGESSIELVDTNPDIDLILMDINLGSGIDGTQAAEKILSKHDLPLVFLSCYVDRETVEKTEGITSYGYIVKDSADTVLNASIKMAFRLFEARVRAKEREKALQDSEEKFRLLAENVPGVIYLCNNDEKWTMLYLNEAVEEITGYHRDEFLQDRISFVDLYHPDDSAAIFKEVQAALAKQEQFRLIYRIKHRNGEWRWIEETGVGIYQNGEVELLEGYLNDITERKRMIEKLQESEAKYRFLAESMNDIIWTTDLKMNITYMSPSFEKVLGFVVDEGMTLPIKKLLTPGSIRLAKTTLVNEMRGDEKRDPGRFVFLELEFYHKNGSVRNLESSLSFIRNENGKPAGIYGLSRDITERKRAEETAKSSEEQIRSIFRAAPIGIGIVRDRILQDVNPRLCEMTGYQKEELIGVSARILYPNQEEFDFVGKEKYRQIAEKGTGSVDTLWRKKDGSIINVLLSSTPIDVNHPERGMTFTALDITCRKQAEQALRESEERYRLMFESSRDAMMTLEPPLWEFTSGNPAIYDIFKVKDVAEFTSLKPWELSPKYQPDGRLSIDKAREMIDKAMSEGHHFFEWVHKRLNGEEFPATVLLTRVEMAGNVFLLATVRDITDRKRAEEEIKRQLAEKEALLKEVHHRIKNNIASIGSLLYLHAKAITNPDAKTILQDAIGRVNSMRMLYDKLLLTTSYQHVSVKNYFDDLIDTIVNIFPDKANITLEKRIDDFQLDVKRLFPIGVILNELLTNIMKYAFIGRDEGLIRITLAKNGKNVRLTVQDNGRGMPENFDIDKSKGFGLMLVKMLTQQLEGKFTMENLNGARSIIDFDI